MAKIKKRKLIWEPSTSPNVISYKLYWAQEGEVSYNSPGAMIGNVTEVILPDQVPSFPIVKGAIQLALTAVNEMGNESDLMIVPAPFQFSVPDPPMDPRLETLKEFHFCQESNPDREEKQLASDPTGIEDGPSLSLGKFSDHLPVKG